LMAKTMRVAQWSGRGGLGYELKLELNHIDGSFLKDLQLQAPFESLKLSAHVNSAAVQVDSLLASTEGMVAESSGMIRGNLLAPKGLMLDASLKLNAELGQMLRRMAPALAAKTGAQGDFV